MNLMSMKTRIRADRIQAYKILHNIDDINALKFFKFSETTHTRNSVEKLFISHSRTNVRKFTLGPTMWNGLPESVKTTLNVIAFKNAIDKTKLILIVGKFYDYDD